MGRIGSCSIAEAEMDIGICKDPTYTRGYTQGVKMDDRICQMFYGSQFSIREFPEQFFTELDVLGFVQNGFLVTPTNPQSKVKASQCWVVVSFDLYIILSQKNHIGWWSSLFYMTPLWVQICLKVWVFRQLAVCMGVFFFFFLKFL